jgi:hypothetical protein
VLPHLDPHPVHPLWLRLELTILLLELLLWPPGPHQEPPLRLPLDKHKLLLDKLKLPLDSNNSRPKLHLNKLLEAV